MYYFGILFYALTISGYFLFAAVKNVVNQAVLLAPQITYACAFLYFFPLFIFLSHFVFKLKSRRYYALLATQTKLAASVAVSLGLIGTFIGLTDMVSAIAGSLGGDGGDITSKLGAMVTSISSALSAMAFAFLTSIIGVSVSVLLLVSLNFWEFYYEADNSSNKNDKKATASDAELQSLLYRMETLETINTNIASKLVYVPENSKLAELLVDNSHIMAERLREINDSVLRLSATQRELLGVVNNAFEHVATSLSTLSDNGREVNQSVSQVALSLNTMTESTRMTNQSLEHLATLLDVISQNSTICNERIELNLDQLLMLNADINLLITLYQKSHQFKEDMEAAKLEKLSAIITHQENYIRQQNEFKNKIKKIVEVLGHEA